MPDTLTQLISKAQAQLLDNGTLFTTPTLTAAARQALLQLNKAIPQNAAVLITAIANQNEYEVTDSDPAALTVTDVLLDGDNDYSTGLPYDAYSEDSRLFIRLRDYLSAGETIIVHYTKPHTLYGLDGSLDSTLPDDLNVIFVTGICAYACLIRSAGTVETNNVQTGVADQWTKSAANWQTIYTRELKTYKLQNTPRGEPTLRAWEDPQHSDVYP
jgi:hypothetical protein